MKDKDTQQQKQRMWKIMYYEINVSLNGQHLFATDKRSITDTHKLETVYNILKEKFPVKEGYYLTVTHYETVGKIIDMENLNKE